MGIYTNKILEKEKEFDLGVAIKSDYVDLIFGGTEELLEESFKYFGKNNMKMLIRNNEEDEINHYFTMKFIPDNERKNDRNFYHDGHYGLPIAFDRGSKEWYVHLGKGKQSKSKAKSIEKDLTRKEKAFITSVVINIGDDILDYWEVRNIHTPAGKAELDRIINKVENQYGK